LRRKVTWSRAALDDLGDAFEFIAQERLEYAYYLVDEIEAAGNRLGAAATGHPGRMAGTFEKSLPKLKYIIAYDLEPSRKDGVITILRVIHTSRNWNPGNWPD